MADQEPLAENHSSTSRELSIRPLTDTEIDDDTTVRQRAFAQAGLETSAHVPGR
jgi:hypothetical protein